jgi:phosphoesterase RecJ-like protein
MTKLLKGYVLYRKLWKLIHESHYITLISHVNPDGDTLGSSLAFYPTLKKMGKNISLVNISKELPKRYDFLPNFHKIKNTMPLKCNLLISFDCGNFDRLGIEKGSYSIINIDHHKSNTNFGDINIVDTSKASCTLLSYEILESKESIQKDEAICIYTGLVDDTNFFTNSNSDAYSFKVASKLIEKGVNPSEVSKNLTMRNSLSQARLTALFINSMELLSDAQVAVGVVFQEDFKKSGALVSDSEALVDILKNLATVELAIMLREKEDGTFKVSLRSKEYLDVASIAISLGGGGHERASGFESELKDKETIIQNIINKAKI